jgi:hypothetical protein
MRSGAMAQAHPVATQTVTVMLNRNMRNVCGHLRAAKTQFWPLPPQEQGSNLSREEAGSGAQTRM